MDRRVLLDHAHLPAQIAAPGLHQGIKDAPRHVLDEVGADGHLLAHDRRHTAIVHGMGQVVAPLGLGEIALHPHVHPEMPPDPGLLRETAVVGEHPDAVHVHHAHARQCSRPAFSRATTSSRPSRAVTSNMPGPCMRPATNSLYSGITWPTLAPCLCSTSLKSASHSAAVPAVDPDSAAM